MWHDGSAIRPVQMCPMPKPSGDVTFLFVHHSRWCDGSAVVAVVTVVLVPVLLVPVVRVTLVLVTLVLVDVLVVV